MNAPPSIDPVTAHSDSDVVHNALLLPSGWRRFSPPCCTAARSEPSGGAKHIAESNKRAAEADLRLKRLHDAIETWHQPISADPGLKERIAEVRIMGSKSDLLQNARGHFGLKIGYWRRSQFCSGLAEGVSVTTLFASYSLEFKNACVNRFLNFVHSCPFTHRVNSPPTVW